MDQPQDQPRQEEPPVPRPLRKRRWLWYAAGLLLLLLAVAAAVPFVLTTQLVRLALQRAYPAFNPTIERASLGISGSITIHGLRLNEPAAPGTLLLSADRLLVHFSWRELRNFKVETVDARGLNVHLRSDEQRPLTLLALVPEESNEPAFWFDRLTADGQAFFGRPGGVKLPVEKMPLDLDVRMEGQRERPDRRIRLALGEAGQSPYLLVQGRANDQRFLVEQASVRGIETVVAADDLRRWIAELPPEVRGLVELRVAAVDVSGTVQFEKLAMPVSGSIDVRGLSVGGLEAAGGKPAKLVDFNTAFAFELDGARPLETVRISDGRSRAGMIQFQQHDVRDVEATWGLNAGQVAVSDLRLRALKDAVIAASGSFDLATRTLRQAMLDVSALDAAMLSRFLPSGPSVQGVFSGSIQVAAELDQQGKLIRYSGGGTLRNLSLSAVSDEVRPWMPGLPDEVSGPLRLGADLIDVQAVVTMNDPKMPLTASGKIRGLSFAAPEAPKDAALALEQFSTEFFASLPLAEPSLAGLSAGSESTRLSVLKYASFDVRDLAAQWSLRDDELRVGHARWRMYKGDLSGQLHMNLDTGVLNQAKFDVGHLDLHELASTLLPGKMDAAGQVSGTIDLHSELDPELRRPTPLRGEVKLASDGPGKLMIGDIKPLQQALTEGKTEELKDVIIAQLRNYPYETGSVMLTTVEEMPELLLSFARKPVQAGEPGHDVPMDYEGRKVRANYTVQITRVVIAMPQQTIDSILLVASGLRVADPKQRR